jgi:hypothetical protein
LRADATARSVRISALALVKMTMHCRSGGNLEARPACSLARPQTLVR